MYHLLIILSWVGFVVLAFLGVGLYLENKDDKTAKKLREDTFGGLLPEGFEFGVGEFETDDNNNRKIIRNPSRYYSNPNGKYKG